MLARIKLALTIAAALTVLPAQAEVKVGDTLPAISGTDQYGGQINLQDFRGHKYVVLYFYPKDFTGGCTLEAQRFAADYSQFASRDAIVLGVSKDPIASHKEFCEKYELPFTLLADPEGSILRTFGVGETYDRRSTFLIDKNGKVIHVIGKVADIPGQNKVLLQQLDEAGAAVIGPEVGKKAPDVVLPSEAGNQTWTLSSERGKNVVVLTFYRGWVGYQCPICMKQAKGIGSVAGEFKKAGAQVVSIYPGTAQQADEFAQKAGIKETSRNPLLVDAHKQAAYAFNVLTADRKEARPATFVIDKDGIVRWAYIGKDAKDRPDIETVQAETKKAAKAPSTQGVAQ